MMMQIYKDLEANIIKIYDHNIITINKYMHHSLKYEEVVKLYQKYKGDVKKLDDTLYAYINQYEIHKKNKRPVGNKKTNFNDVDELFNFFANGNKQAGTHVNLEPELDPKIPYYSPDLQGVFNLAKQFEIAKLQRQAQNGSGAVASDVSYSSFLRAVIELSKNEQMYAYINQILKDSGFDIEKFIKDDNLGTSSDKPILEELCTNLNKKALQGKLQAVIGRDEEIDQLINILCKAKKNNPVLVGKAGTGKTAIVEGLAKRIVEGDVPDALKNAVIYSLEIVNLVKGTGYRGDFEKKASGVIDAIKEKEESGEMPILFIDELHTIMGAGASGQGSLDFSNIMKPALARGELRTIGATTTDEWHTFIKENSAMDRRFVSVSIIEPSFDVAKQIINESLGFYEKKHGVKYDKGTVERSIELSQQFIVDNALPDKAFDLIDVAGSRSQVLKLKKVTIEDIEYSLAKHKNIDLDAILNSRRKNFQPLAPKLEQMIFGQNEAIEKVAKSVEMVRAGLNNPNKPYGVFLFTGPTGTGKTELAKQVAKCMNAKYHRIDCSEFKEAHTISKIIGSPPGYIGYEAGSSLTKIITEFPRMVLLLDEFEKAHEDIHKLFLQAMDYGKLTDSKGKEINFKNVMIIMTSNVGAMERNKRTVGLGADNSIDKKEDSKAVSQIFSPEFRGRLTGNSPIQFNSLKRDSYEKIIEKALEEIYDTNLKKLNINLKLSPEVVDKIVKHGEEINLGARPIIDYIYNEIISKLADLVIFGDLKDLRKNKEVLVIIQNNKIKLTY